jgi:hypothetical protein
MYLVYPGENHLNSHNLRTQCNQETTGMPAFQHLLLDGFVEMMRIFLQLAQAHDRKEHEQQHRDAFSTCEETPMTLNPCIMNQVDLFYALLAHCKLTREPNTLYFQD